MKRVRITLTYSGTCSVDTEVDDDFELTAQSIDFDRWPELDRPDELTLEDYKMREL